MGKITYEQYKKIFKKNADGSYYDLKITDDITGSLFDFSGKKPEEYTIDEIIVLKKYAEKISKMVDVNSIN